MNRCEAANGEVDGNENKRRDSSVSIKIEKSFRLGGRKGIMIGEVGSCGI